MYLPGIRYCAAVFGFVLFSLWIAILKLTFRQSFFRKQFETNNYYFQIGVCAVWPLQENWVLFIVFCSIEFRAMILKSNRDCDLCWNLVNNNYDSSTMVLQSVPRIPRIDSKTSSVGTGAVYIGTGFVLRLLMVIFSLEFRHRSIHNTYLHWGELMNNCVMKSLNCSYADVRWKMFCKCNIWSILANQQLISGNRNTCTRYWQ